MRTLAIHPLFYNRNPVNFIYEPFLEKAPLELENIYDDFVDGKYFPPVRPKNIGWKGWGVFAEEGIQPMTYICEYAGDLLPETHAKFKPEYNMKLMSGPTPERSMLITVLRHAGIGPLLNHSENNANCRTMKFFLGDMCRIVIFAFKRINIGEELTYNYNGGDGKHCTKAYH